MRRGLLLAALFFPAGAAFASGPPPVRLDLAETVRRARERNASVLMAGERVRQALARLGQSRSVLRPQVSAGVSGTRQTRNLEASGIELPGRDPLVGPFNVFDARVRLTQALFDENARRRLEEARAGRALSEAQRRRAAQDAMALAAALYVEARRAREAVATAEILFRRDRERLEVARARKEAGLSSALDAEQAQVAAAAGRRTLEAARTAALERRQDLAVALGLDAGTEIEFSTAVETSDLSGPRSGVMPTDSAALRAALESHPDAISAREELSLRRAGASAVRGEVLPKASLGADYGAIGESPADAKTTYTVGLQALVPVLEGGRAGNRRREAESQEAESRLRLEDVERRLAADIRAAGQSLESAGWALESAEKDAAFAGRQAALAAERAESGLGSRLEASDAAAQAVYARDRRDEARAGYDTARIRWARALGRVESLTEEPHP